MGGKQQEQKVEQTGVTTELSALQECFILQVNIFKTLFSGASASFDVNEHHQ